MNSDNPNKLWTFIDCKKCTTKISKRMSYNNQVMDNLQDIMNAFVVSTVWNPVFTYIQRGNACSNYLHFQECSDEEVFEALRKIKPKKR